MTTFITAKEVAPKIGYDCVSTFLMNRDRLERDHDFPLPMPTLRRPMRWRATLVDAWIARQGLHTPPPSPTHNTALLVKAGRV